jgi:competence protein ComFC
MKQSIQKFQSSLRDASVALLYPTQCRVCGLMIDSLSDGVACRQCWQAVEAARLNFDYCEKCDVSLPRRGLLPQPRRCRLCDDFAFIAARSAGTYVGALRESVLRLKVEPMIPDQLRHRLHAAFLELPNYQDISVIIPTPLHSSRQQQRQFNQSEIIAQTLAPIIQLPVVKSALNRTKPTEQHRAGMDAQARLQSLRGAFSVYAPRLVVDRTILVVDDVMTTGSTAHEISQTLLENGARAVSILTLTRAAHSYS